MKTFVYDILVLIKITVMCNRGVYLFLNVAVQVFNIQHDVKNNRILLCSCGDCPPDLLLEYGERKGWLAAG